MSSTSTTADVEPEEVTQQHVSSEDEDGDLDGTNNSFAELIVSGVNTSDVTSDEYSSRISVLQNQVKSLRASYAIALQDREDAESQETLYNKRLDAEMHKSSVMKNEMRAIENSKAELHRTLNQLEADIQQESCSMPEHALMKEELVELKTKHQQLEKQHEQQALMLQEFQNENATLEGRLSNIGTEKPTDGQCHRKWEVVDARCKHATSRHNECGNIHTSCSRLW